MGLNDLAGRKYQTAIRTKEVLRKMHNGSSGAHSGVKQTLSKVRERFYWVRCREDVEKWCTKCGGQMTKD